MKTVRVTQDNVSAIMSVLNIADDMLMERATADYCKLCKSGSCRDACEKYQLSGERDSVGHNRGSACILFRLLKLKRGHGDTELYAPADLLDRAYECEDI